MKTPLDSRYSSSEMKKLFSAISRHSVWRMLWYLLAQAQKEVGLDSIGDEALAQMADHLTVTDEDFGSAAVEAEKRRHDVVSLHAFQECGDGWLTD
jgi:adenylosuccinate lyase